MRTLYGFAWGKLYQAVLAMATSTAPLPERVAAAFRIYLGQLNSQTLPPELYERLKAVRAQLSSIAPDHVDEDQTIDVRPLLAPEAILIAEEILSLYDEIAKTDARERSVMAVR